MRLLRLLPAPNADDPIECRLDVVAFAEPPRYEALSYCWGGNDRSGEIKCNGEPFPVTENLLLALRSLRREDAARTLWIDAVCINQENLAERKSQVMRMGQIYSGATSAVIWLGPEPTSDGVHHLFELAERYPKIEWVQVSRKWKALFDSSVPGSECPYEDDGQDEEGSTPKLPELSQEVLDGVSAMMRRPWWTRMWTIQELALAPTAVVMCGDLSVPWQAVRSAFLMAMQLSFRQGSDAMEANTPVPDFSVKESTAIAYSRLSYSWSDDDVGYRLPCELGELLLGFRWSTARDPKDKIYGLLGLAKSAYGIEPDYAISTTVCYTRATFAIITGNGNLDILRGLRKPTCLGDSTVPGLPSWVPDWAYDFSSIPKEAAHPVVPFRPLVREIWLTSQSYTSASLFPQFQASGPTLEFLPRLKQDGTTLILRGLIVDELEVLGRNLRYPAPMPVTPTADRLKNWLREKERANKLREAVGELLSTVGGWKDMALSPKHLHTEPDETREDAFLVTICKNRIPTDADRAAALGHMRECMRSMFDYSSKTATTLKMLGFQHVNTRLYRTLLGYTKEQKMEEQDILLAGLALVHLRWAIDQRMARTKGGYLALMPEPCKVGDKIVLLEGGKTPYVLRAVGKQWKILGDCYVHGMMSGEAWHEEGRIDVEII
ncbi:hypothetical protein ACJZ2D_007798 [Fusarium nematophilum]